MSSHAYNVPEPLLASIADKLDRLAERSPLPDTPAAAAITASLPYVWALQRIRG